MALAGRLLAVAAANSVLCGESATAVYEHTRQCIAAWSVTHNFVVMLSFKFMYAILCGILRYLSLVVSCYQVMMPLL